MKCPFCSSILSKVIDKRAVGGRGEIRRRRECLKCTKRFTTYESLAKLEILVVKKNGHKEPYSREKLQLGIEKALEKRPGVDKVVGLVDKIEGKIRAKRLREIPTTLLGKTVLMELKKLDTIAYLRFASVYQNYQDPKDFERELKSLS